MKFNFNKILAAFGNTRAMKHTQIDNDIEDIINSIDEEAFAVSEHNVFFAKISELGGYYYIITIIVGAFKIKTMKGAKLNVEGENFNLILNSDINEFESNHYNVSNRYITRIDFQIEEADIPKFDKKGIKTLKLSTKKQDISFTTL
ncbi:hypothetical protein GCM10023311_02310 [Flaviramulus aquimarinus]|uniref:Uncharacterized protein n=1 Tax=Flaviramulus aquimarinus TaxID=1170456 RepID=A0ABP9EQI5_9FLAO